MVNKIIVKDIIGSEYAVAPEDGSKIYDRLESLIKEKLFPVTVDFEGITRTTTAFFNSSLSVFLKDFTSEELNKYFNFTNLTPTGLIMFRDSIDLAKLRFGENSELDRTIKEELKGE